MKLKEEYGLTNVNDFGYKGIIYLGSNKQELKVKFDTTAYVSLLILFYDS